MDHFYATCSAMWLFQQKSYISSYIRQYQLYQAINKTQETIIAFFRSSYMQKWVKYSSCFIEGRTEMVIFYFLCSKKVVLITFLNFWNRTIWDRGDHENQPSLQSQPVCKVGQMFFSSAKWKSWERKKVVQNNGDIYRMLMIYLGKCLDLLMSPVTIIFLSSS